MDRKNKPGFDFDPLDIALKEVPGLVCGFAVSKLMEWGMNTFRDIQRFDFMDVFLHDESCKWRSPGWGFSIGGKWYYRKENADDARSFQKSIRRLIETKVEALHKYADKILQDNISFTPDETTALTPLYHLRGLISDYVLSRLKHSNIHTVQGLLEIDLVRLFMVDGIGPIIKNEILQIRSKIKTRPAMVAEFLHQFELTPQEEFNSEQSLSKLVPEMIRYEDGQELTRQKFLAIELYDIMRGIPNQILLQLRPNNIKTIKQLMDCKASQLKIAHYHPQKILKEISALRHSIIKNPEKFRKFNHAYAQWLAEKRAATAYKYPKLPPLDISVFRINARLLPIDPEIMDTADLPLILKTILLDFIASAQKTNLTYQELLLYYGINSPRKTLAEISETLNHSGTICRKKLETEMDHITTILQGKKVKFVDAWMRTDARIVFIDLIRLLSSRMVHNYEEIKTRFISGSQLTPPEEKEHLLKLFLHAFGYYLHTPKKYSLLKETLVIYGIKNLLDFHSLITQLKNFIIDAGEFISEHEIIHHFQKKYDQLKCNHISQLISRLPGIEMQEMNGKKYYRLQISAEMKINQIVYRILSEKGHKMYWKEIQEELDRLSALYQISYPQFHAGNIQADKRLKPIGKTGYWSLTQWGLNTDPQKELIRQALLKLERPATAKEIFALITKIRPDIPYNSIKTILPMYFMVSPARTYILPEWKNKYPGHAMRPFKEIKDPGDWPSLLSLRHHITALLQAAPGNKLTLNDIRQCLHDKNILFTAPKISILLHSKKYFSRTFFDRNNIIIGLPQ